MNGDKKKATPTEMAKAIQLPAILFASCLILDIGLRAISSATVGLDYSFSKHTRHHGMNCQTRALRGLFVYTLSLSAARKTPEAKSSLKTHPFNLPAVKPTPVGKRSSPAVPLIALRFWCAQLPHAQWVEADFLTR